MGKHWVRSDILAGIFALLIFVSVNLISDRLFDAARLDLTAEGLYTVSDGTRAVLNDLAEPITVTLYFSETAASAFPPLFAYGRRVRDLLEEYADIADGLIRLRVIDPKPFTEAEDRAVAAGIRGLPVGDGTSVYLGLVAEDATDRRSVIPYLSRERERFLEYDLTKLLYTLDAGERPQVALLTSLPLAGGAQPANPFAGGGGAQPPQVIYEQLQELFDLTDLDPAFETLPEGLDLLLLIHPPELGTRQRYLIDQYVLRGGRAVVLLDPYSEAAAIASPFPGAPGGAPASSNLPGLLGAWGVEFTAEEVVADADLAQRVNFGGGGFREVKDYLLWLALGRDQIARDDPVTGPVEGVNMASTGALSAMEGADTQLEPLLTSSPTSALIAAEQVEGQPNPDRLLRDFMPDDTRYILAARVTGRAASAFGDAPPEPDTEGEAPMPDAADHVAQGEIALIVVADADIVDDRFWVQTQQLFGQRIVQPIADNGVLMVNMIDAFTGSDALLSLRGRGTAQRPFTRVEALRRQAEARFLEQEERLEAQLAETERRLAELQEARGEEGLFLSPEQEAEIERFQAQRLEVRQELRRVQRNLRGDIEALGETLAFINIGLVPGLVIVAALVWFGWKRRRAQA